MKTYGVNWFLVWVGQMVWMCSTGAWLRELIYPHPGPATWVMVLTQASFMSALFTNFRYSDSSSRPKRGATRRLRWLIICATVSAIVAATSVAVKTILDRPSWLHVIGYSLLLPCCFAASGWLTNKVTNEWQKGRLLEGGRKEAP